MKDEKRHIEKKWCFTVYFNTALARASSFIFHLSFFILLLAAASCGKRGKIIPDDKLAYVFRDIYLTNAYNQQHRTPNFDSLNIYEPVFAKYGYTTEDVQLTIGNFAKRKSARLSDVVDNAIDLLDKEDRFYQRRIAIYDTIGLVARDRYMAVVYTDSLIEVRKIADTARLRIVVPTQVPGTYEVSYSYYVDSTDRNNNLRVNHYLVDNRNRQSANNTRRLRRFDRENVTASFTADGSHRKLVLDLNGYPEDMTKPNMTVNDLTVKRYLSDRTARDSMARQWFDYRMGDTLLNPLRGVPPVGPEGYIILPDEKDIVALPADARRTSAR